MTAGSFRGVYQRTVDPYRSANRAAYSATRRGYEALTNPFSSQSGVP